MKRYMKRIALSKEDVAYLSKNHKKNGYYCPLNVDEPKELEECFDKILEATGISLLWASDIPNFFSEYSNDECKQLSIKLGVNINQKSSLLKTARKMMVL